MVQVQGATFYIDAAHTELVLSLTAPAEHCLFTLIHPDRVVIDVDHAGLKTALPAAQGLVSSLRSGNHADACAWYWTSPPVPPPALSSAKARPALNS